MGTDHMEKGKVLAFEATGEKRLPRNGDAVGSAGELFEASHDWQAGNRHILRPLSEDELRARFGPSPEERAVIEAALELEHSWEYQRERALVQAVQRLRESRAPKPAWSADGATVRGPGTTLRVEMPGDFGFRPEKRAAEIARILNAQEPGGRDG